MAKSPDAFRTISEVAEWLDRPAHVLRFWESKFTQIKPVKRAGGRRYYRPQDMLLLGGIKKLLHDDGMTIKGVQKLLRENGVQHVAALSQPLDGGETIEAAPAPQPEAMTPEAEPADNLVAFKRPEPEPAPAKPKPAAEPEQASLFEFPPAAEPVAEPVEDARAEAPELEAAPAAETEPETVSEPETPEEPAPEPEAAPEEQVSAASEELPAAEQAPEMPAAEAPVPGILSRILTREAKLPGTDLTPILQRVRSHADALGKASRDR